MQAKELNQFKKSLIEFRKELVKQMGSIKTEEREQSLKEEDGDTSAYSFHLADQGTDNMLQEQSFFHVQRNGELLHQVDQALERIEKGIFGKCESCDKGISKNRLKVIPYASLCVDCQSKEEGQWVNRNGMDDTREVRSDEDEEIFSVE